MREIERRIEEEENPREKEILEKLTNIPRLWLRKNISHPYKLPGITFFNHLQVMISAVSDMRERKDHHILQSLECLLEGSIDDVVSIAEDIAQAEVWINEITDILLGKADDNGKRHTEEYKKKMTGKKVKEKLFGYIISLYRKKEQYSPFLQDVLKHFRKTFNNWQEHLFTCYDHKFLPNTNLDLELSHSRMKRKHRRMTGLKNSQQFLLLHGEQMAFCFDFDFSYEILIPLLQAVDYERVRIRAKEELEKSVKRGKDRKTLKNLSKSLQEMTDEWGI